jgi:hypothetical protein
VGVEIVRLKHDNAEQNHWSERGRATSVSDSDAMGRPRRSVWSFGKHHHRHSAMKSKRSYFLFPQRASLFCALAGVCVLGSLRLSAQTFTRIVGGKAAVFGAGSLGTAFDPPADPPVTVVLSPGRQRYLTVASVTGSTTPQAGGPWSIEPDGGNVLDATVDISSYGEISGIVDRSTTGAMALLGVFTTDAPTNVAPPRLDVTDLKSAFNIAPMLNQTFFVGDGLTGSGLGTQQRVLVPEGATRLNLGFADGYDDTLGYPGGGMHGAPRSYADNGGSLTITGSVAPFMLDVSSGLLCWDSLSNRMYQLEYQANLTSSIWLDFRSAVTGTGARICITNWLQPQEPNRFLRLVESP